MINNFLNPYFILINRAAWSIQQNLEGSGLLSSVMSQQELPKYPLVNGWNPGSSVHNIVHYIDIYLSFLLIVSILACFVIKKLFGVIIGLAAWLIPGVISLVGLWPMIPLSPRQFVIEGAGVTGDIWGMSSLVLIGVISGWSISILVIDLLNIRNRFWDAYDHLWTVLGLIAAITFVADLQTARHDADYRDAGSDTQQASAYLLKQIELYDLWCHQNPEYNLSSCKWASNIHQTLLDYSYEDPKLFANHGPKSSQELYGDFRKPASIEESNHIRLEIYLYNQTTCPVKSPHNFIEKSSPSSWLEEIEQDAPASSKCEITPPQFCRAYPDILFGSRDDIIISRPTALATECIIPTLVRLQDTEFDTQNETNQDHRNRHYRWAYFILFSTLLGGKLAGSTSKFFLFDTRADIDKTRVLSVLENIRSFLVSIIIIIVFITLYIRNFLLRFL